MSKFLNPKNGTVYHCIPVTPIGEVIKPSSNYGSFISSEIRNKLHIHPDEQVPLIFGATHISKAMAFGLQGILNEKILNHSYNDVEDGELVIACDRQAMLSRKRDITIYEMENRDFVNLDYAERQSVSARPIPFNETKIAFKAHNAEDLMRGGLQIFAFNESWIELEEKKILEDIRMSWKQDFYKFLGDLVNDGKIIWENKTNNINPDPFLAKKIGVKLLEVKQDKKRNTQKPKCSSLSI